MTNRTKKLLSYLSGIHTPAYLPTLQHLEFQGYRRNRIATALLYRTLPAMALLLRFREGCDGQTLRDIHPFNNTSEDELSLMREFCQYAANLERTLDSQALERLHLLEPKMNKLALDVFTAYRKDLSGYRKQPDF